MTTDPSDPFNRSLQQATTHLQQGKVNEALDLLRELLREQPENVVVLHLLGIAQRRGGMLDQAVQLQESILRKEPEFAAAFQELGICHSTAGRSDEAIAAFRRATEIDARMVNSWKYLGDLLLAQGDIDAAFEAYAQCPVEGDQDPVLERAREMLRANQPGQADQILRAFLKRHGQDARALYLLAQVAIRIGAVTDAMDLLESVLDAAPGHTQARFEYVNLLSRRQRYPEALAAAETLIEAAPDQVPFHLLKAALLDRTGQYPAAAEILRTLLDNNPGQAHVWTGLSTLQRTMGQQPEAITSLHKAIDVQPDRGEAWYLLADLKVYRFSDAQVQAMSRSLEHAAAGSEDEVFYSFALGRAFEDRSDWTAAFEHYERGNRAQKRRSRFDLEHHLTTLNSLRSVTNADFLRSRMATAQADADEAVPVFIVGLPRSGSTLVEQVITAHSQVDGTMELPILATLVKELNYRQRKANRSAWPQALTELDEADFREIGREYLERSRILRGDQPFFVDKMPNNFEYAALIRLALPRARIIDVRREPMANGFSAFRQLFLAGQEWSYDLADIGRYYRAYERLMTHWDAVLPGYIHRIDYEALIEDPRPEIERLLACLALEVEPACFEPHRNSRPVRTASSEQVRQPMYRDALTHWKHFESQLEPLRAALAASEE
ncbi:tetratricopeptide repeat-containing sulfotransferase family protein [Elongatibacter sediminis]|uniref:Sulfotransferase n=1 Tax=Elongatibacter sediminis TaxID=3119006 RepID=A0AAW9RIY1_9GAMM